MTPQATLGSVSPLRATLTAPVAAATGQSMSEVPCVSLAPMSMGSTAMAMAWPANGSFSPSSAVPCHERFPEDASLDPRAKSSKARDPVVTEDGTVARVVVLPDGSGTIEVWSGGRWVSNASLGEAAVRWSDLMMARRASSADFG